MVTGVCNFSPFVASSYIAIFCVVVAVGLTFEYPNNQRWNVAAATATTAYTNNLTSAEYCLLVLYCAFGKLYHANKFSFEPPFWPTKDTA